MACPLCKNQNVSPYHRDDRREYIQCQVCRLIFVPSQYFLTETDEKARYDLHQNNPLDVRYRQFLGRLFHPMNDRMRRESYGLDFGSGPRPTLSVMFEEVGHTVVLYDLYFACNPDIWNDRYDFITATEVLEHLKNPKEDLERLWGCLKQNGYLGIMTKRALEPSRFRSWHYKDDETHICFFSHFTFKWLAKSWNAPLVFCGDDVVIFAKN